MRLYAPLAALMAAIFVSGCSKHDDHHTVTASCAGDGIVASDAWVRAARAGLPMSAAYVSLCNGGETDRLIGATFDGAAAVELHNSTMSEDGVASMAPMEGGLDLPAGGVATLAPGGAHLMLIGLNDALAEGDEVTITLEFEHAPPMTLTFEIRNAAGGHAGH